MKTNQASPPSESTKVSLLLVDDNAANLIVLEAVLGDSGYNLVKARSGAEAIALVEQQDFALIILDVQMPGMDGFETAKRIKRLERGKDIPIVFMTAIFREDPFIRRGYEVGAIDYFGKPFDPDIFKAKVSIYANLFQKTRLIHSQRRRLAETEKLLHSGNLKIVLEALPVGVFLGDQDGRVYQSNEEARRILGCVDEVDVYSEQSLTGWHVADGQRVKPDEWPMTRALKSGETVHNDLLTILCGDGSQKTILYSASLLHGEAGDVIGVVGVIQDITAQRQLEAGLLHRNNSKKGDARLPVERPHSN
jgi:PAS domain S-box-containing protein